MGEGALGIMALIKYISTGEAKRVKVYLIIHEHEFGTSTYAYSQKERRDKDLERLKATYARDLEDGVDNLIVEEVVLDEGFCLAYDTIVREKDRNCEI